MDTVVHQSASGEVANMSEVIADLRAVSDLKVWSLLVTLFGDAAMAEETRLSGPALHKMLAPLGIQPEALRVSLHRLRKDGWVISERQGRVGLHGLSDHGRAKTKEVAGRIYGAAPPAQRNWFLVVQPEGNYPPKQGLSLGFGRHLCLEKAPSPALSARWRGPVPAWVRERVLPPGLEDDFAALNALLAPAAEPTCNAEAALLRLLILHHWRRLVLRTPPLAESLLGPDWTGGECRATVHEWLTKLPLAGYGAVG
jgi:phenylacetic acid degradation operon negative regulatory protein